MDDSGGWIPVHPALHLQWRRGVNTSPSFEGTTVGCLRPSKRRTHTFTSFSSLSSALPQETYASVPRALWAEIINLHGATRPETSRAGAETPVGADSVADPPRKRKTTEDEEVELLFS